MRAIRERQGHGVIRDRIEFQDKIGKDSSVLKSFLKRREAKIAKATTLHVKRSGRTAVVLPRIPKCSVVRTRIGPWRAKVSSQLRFLSLLARQCYFKQQK